MLDPFAGSGSTCVAARREGFFFIGIEQELEYVEIARKRVGEIDTVPKDHKFLFSDIAKIFNSKDFGK